MEPRSGTRTSGAGRTGRLLEDRVDGPGGEDGAASVHKGSEVLSGLVLAEVDIT